MRKTVGAENAGKLPKRSEAKIGVSGNEHKTSMPVSLAMEPSICYPESQSSFLI
jgi:hypothetical protein